MRIIFSRHAKRRARLYGISETSVKDILRGMDLSPGVHTILQDIEGLPYPLKIVVSVDRNAVTVITNYPLKKGRKK